MLVAHNNKRSEFLTDRPHLATQSVLINISQLVYISASEFFAFGASERGIKLLGR